MTTKVLKGAGLVAIHGCGNFLERELVAGEQIGVGQRACMYDSQVVAETLRLGLMGGTNMFLNRFTGPGKLRIQSMAFHLHTGD